MANAVAKEIPQILVLHIPDEVLALIDLVYSVGVAIEPHYMKAYLALFHGERKTHIA